jgi:hypothetical protein
VIVGARKNVKALLINYFRAIFGQSAYFVGESAYFVGESAYFVGESAYFVGESAYFVGEIKQQILLKCFIFRCFYKTAQNRKSFKRFLKAS